MEPEKEKIGIKLIVCFDDKATNKSPITLENPTEDYLKELNGKGFGIFQTANSFFATTDQLEKTGFKTKRHKEFISSLNEVFGDLDICKDTDNLPGEERDRLKNQLMGAINNYCPASVYVITKNGLQPRWWLMEPNIDEVTQQKYVNITNGIIEWSKQNGAKGDPVKDVTRVLRKPGYYHHKSEPYLVTEENGNGKTYTLDELKKYFWSEPVVKVYGPVEKESDLSYNQIDSLDIRQVVIDVWKEKGGEASFDKDDHLIIDGAVTATFAGRLGEGNYIATSSSDYPAKGNAVTYVAETLGISRKEAFKWICKKYNINNKPKLNLNSKIFKDVSFKIKRWEEIRSLPFIEQKWKIKGLIPNEGFVILAGVSGEGKTWLAMEMARCITLGIDFAGNPEFSTTEGNVLYIDGEMSVSEFQRRGKQLELSEERNKIFIMNGDDLNLDEDDTVRNLISYIKENEICVVFIDTLRAVSGGIEEDRAEKIRVFFNRFKPLKDLSVAVVFLDHFRKPAMREVKTPKKEKLLGSQDKIASVEILLMLILSEDKTIDVYQMKNRLGKELSPFQLFIEDIEDPETNSKKTIIRYKGEIKEDLIKKEKMKEILPILLKDGEKDLKELKIIICEEEKVGGSKNLNDALKELLKEKIIDFYKEGKKHIYFLREGSKDTLSEFDDILSNPDTS
jgi:hypothetical protein